jgi:hypothetical protein
VAKKYTRDGEDHEEIQQDGHAEDRAIQDDFACLLDIGTLGKAKSDRRRLEE